MDFQVRLRVTSILISGNHDVPAGSAYERVDGKGD